MKFCWCTINVNNMEESLKFYQEIVGLKLDRKFGTGPDMEIAFLGEGETKVELIHNVKNNDVDLGKDISMGFEVNSLDEKIAMLKEKGITVAEPFQPNPHVKFIFVQDPNGLRIQFVENI